ncbi:MAG: DUF3311 domain-containing protein [Bryobacterales bacterium]|jgi:hypothetical protein|nr:DUF3311 domain-containing protein [Bryobacterales bacterium]
MGKLLAAVTLGLYIAHQDFWFWTTADPLLFGFLPAGLWYHALYVLAASALLAALTKYAWPAELEREVEEMLREDKRR